eukprot:TRINITY_DN7481_c0_g1_i1.p2 TRINITY_DN7481_c0_g1~~TRINITY_DN7481_c0_g1_i1.p2  ORF type:complete len:266 (-),score=11.40 TRINITY_DN7481_c0_g1_i1:174-971(-)
MRARDAGPEHPILAPVVAEYTLAFLSPSLMVRSTCTTFRCAADAVHKEKDRCSTIAADTVASTRLIRWALQYGLIPRQAQEGCIRRGDLEGLRRLRDTCVTAPLLAVHACRAASRGDLPMLQWLRQNNCPWESSTCASAAIGGHLNVLQWARDNGCPWNEWTCQYAAMYGHLEVLQWARAQGCPWNTRICASAAMFGHLEILQWARANGCPWNENTCSQAAGEGHLRVLQWARANGCPWDSRTTNCAAMGGQVETLQWARAHGCP